MTLVGRRANASIVAVILLAATSRLVEGAVEKVEVCGTVPAGFDLRVHLNYCNAEVKQPGVMVNSAGRLTITEVGTVRDVEEIVSVGADGKFSYTGPVLKEFPVPHYGPEAVARGQWRLNSLFPDVIRHGTGQIAHVAPGLKEMMPQGAGGSAFEMLHFKGDIPEERTIVRASIYRRGKPPDEQERLITISDQREPVAMAGTNDAVFEFLIEDKTDDASMRELRERVLRGIAGTDAKEQSWAMDRIPGYVSDQEIEPKLALGLAMILTSEQGRRAALLLQQMTEQEFYWAGATEAAPGYSVTGLQKSPQEKPSSFRINEEFIRKEEAGIPGQLATQRARMQKEGRTPQDIEAALESLRSGLERRIAHHRSMVKREQLGYWDRIVPVEHAEEWLRGFYGLPKEAEK